MPAQIEARGLSGHHRGRHVSLMVPGGRYTGPRELAGELITVTHWGDGKLSMIVLRNDGPKAVAGITPETPVTITGSAPWQE